VSASTPPIAVRVIPVTPFQQNTTLVSCTATNKAVFIDPGGEVDRLLAAVGAAGVTVEAVWLTHGHLDHAGGADEIRERLGVPIIGPHADDAWLLSGITDDAAKYGMTGMRSVSPDRWLADGEELTLGNLTFGVTHCPGHTPGHVVIWNALARLAFVGDVLFKGSVGRTDFPRGNHADLVASITEKLWPLGDDMQFVPGHGQTSTFGWERRTNPYVSDLALGRA
jgi:hydroxyacylglutathione hydrolase